MPRFQILHFPGPEMARLPKKLNQKLGFSGKKFRQMLRIKIANSLGGQIIPGLKRSATNTFFILSKEWKITIKLNKMCIHCHENLVLLDWWFNQNNKIEYKDLEYDNVHGQKVVLWVSSFN